MYQTGLITSKSFTSRYFVSYMPTILYSYAISYDAERSRNVSHQVRQDARRLINETYNESWWNKHDKYVDKFYLFV